MHWVEQPGDGPDGGGDGMVASAHPPSPPPPAPPPSTEPAIKVKITDKNEIAGGFNKFYATVGTKLVDKIREQNAIQHWSEQAILENI